MIAPRLLNRKIGGFKKKKKKKKKKKNRMEYSTRALM
jgi:hypothetical protein